MNWFRRLSFYIVYKFDKLWTTNSRYYNSNLIFWTM